MYARASSPTFRRRPVRVRVTHVPWRRRRRDGARRRGCPSPSHFGCGLRPRALHCSTRPPPRPWSSMSARRSIMPQP
eukprot:2871097-Prymnesium_polylepis.1